jgi:predicted DNA binding protein
VEFKDSTTKIQELLSGGFLVEAQVLERAKNGSYIVFIRGGPIVSSVVSGIGVQGGYLFPPIGIGDGKIKISFIGNEMQVKEFMEKIDAIGIHYKVVLLADVNFSPISPLSQLTEKQREVLIKAYKLGYYDIPRKITTEELAQKLGLVDSTVVEHLRKAEQRLITQIIEQ